MQLSRKKFPKDSPEALTNRQKNIQRSEDFLEHNRSKTTSNYKPRQLYGKVWNRTYQSNVFDDPLD